MREKEFIKRSYTTITYYSGYIAIFSGMILLLPLLTLFFYPEEAKTVRWFAVPSLISILIGLILVILFRKREKITVSLTHSAVIVVFAWLYSCLLGAFPFALCDWVHNADPVRFTYLHGLFEAVSGWTTTGLTIVDTDVVPRILLVWRSIMQYLGGAGFAVVMLSVLSGPSASGIYKAEGHHDEILPHVKQSAAMVLGIYLFYLVVGIVAYILAGMNVFDAINHCMTALATGGFSTHNSSIGYYSSVPIELVTIVLMIIGHINFATHHYIFQKNWKVVYRNAEIRSSAALLLIFIPVAVIFVGIPLYASARLNLLDPFSLKAIVLPLRKTAFEVISALTGTGFTTVNYPSWTSLGCFIIIILMCAGGHTNSTSGGIKQLRIYLFFKSIYWMIRDEFLPKTAVSAYYLYKGENRMYIKPQHLRELFNYVLLYIISLLVGSAILMGAGFDMKAALFEFASAQGTVGLSYGITSYSSSAVVLITEILGMFLGRLEFFVIFYCIIKIFRDVKVVMRSES